MVRTVENKVVCKIDKRNGLPSHSIKIKSSEEPYSLYCCDSRKECAYKIIINNKKYCSFKK